MLLHGPSLTALACLPATSLRCRMPRHQQAIHRLQEKRREQTRRTALQPCSLNLHTFFTSLSLAGVWLLRSLDFYWIFSQRLAAFTKHWSWVRWKILWPLSEMQQTHHPWLQLEIESPPRAVNRSFVRLAPWHEAIHQRIAPCVWQATRPTPVLWVPAQTPAHQIAQLGVPGCLHSSSGGQDKQSWTQRHKAGFKGDWKQAIQEHVSPKARTRTSEWIRLFTCRLGFSLISLLAIRQCRRQRRSRKGEGDAWWGGRGSGGRRTYSLLLLKSPVRLWALEETRVHLKYLPKHTRCLVGVPPPRPRSRWRLVTGRLKGQRLGLILIGLLLLLCCWCRR